jgi:hypothetical protein
MSHRSLQRRLAKRAHASSYSALCFAWAALAWMTAGLATVAHADATSWSPVVLLLQSTASCTRGKQTNISSFVENDMKHLEALFTSAGIETLGPYDLNTYRANELNISKRVFNRVLVVFYSGHGVSEQLQGSGHRLWQSALCAQQGRLVPVDELIHWTTGLRPRWASLVLSACESADVDPSAADPIRVSVLSASMDAVTAALVDANGTDFMQAIADTIREALTPQPTATQQRESPDRDGDGYLSDEELFASVAQRLPRPAIARGAIEPNFAAVPKLRRNDSLPLPLFPLSSRQRGTLPDAASEAPEELLNRVAAERRATAAGKLPEAGFDYVYFEDAETQLACSQQQIGSDHRDIQRVCELLRERTRPGSCYKLGPMCRSQLALEAIARAAISFEVLRVSVRNGWVQVHRLRDDHLVAISRISASDLQLPSQARILSTTDDGWSTVRVERYVSRQEMSELGAVPALCGAATGQCFEVPPDRKPKQSACLADFPSAKGARQ